MGGFGWDSHIVLPALVLAARPIAQIARVTSLSLQEVLVQDYVAVARSKGLHPTIILGRHIMRNALIPILTTIGISLRFSLSSLPVVEYFFGWNGAGSLLLKSIAQQDDNLTLPLLLSLGLLFAMVNLLLESSYKRIDPRLGASVPTSSSMRRSLQEPIAALGAAVRDALRHNPLSEWWEKRRRPPEPNPFREVLLAAGDETSVALPQQSIGNDCDAGKGSSTCRLC